MFAIKLYEACDDGCALKGLSLLQGFDYVSVSSLRHSLLTFVLLAVCCISVSTYHYTNV